MRYLLLLLTITFFISCNFSEEITFNEDGSGEFSVSYDMGTVLKEVKKMGGSSKEGKKGEKRDTVFFFKDFIKEKADSIATLSDEEQKRFKAMEKISMKLSMDEEKEVFDMTMGVKFDSMNELSEAIKALDDAQKMNSKDYSSMGKLRDNSIAKGATNTLENVDFYFDGKSFSRKFMSESKEKIDVEAINKEMDQLKEMKDLFEAMTYSVTYNFPKKIKKVNNKNAKLSRDKKSIELTVNFLDLMKDPTILNIDVDLK